MTVYFIIKFLHVIGAIVILGTGSGIALLVLLAHRSRDLAFIAGTADAALIGIAALVGGAMAVQPFTGGLLMEMSSTSAGEPWMLASILLYAAAGVVWIPVLLMQIEIRGLIRQAVMDGAAELPTRYHTLFRRGAWLGALGFAMVLAILWLMIAKP